MCPSHSALHLPSPGWLDQGSHLTHNGPDSLSPGNLELGLRNSFRTQVYPKHAKFGVWASLICHVMENSLEREKNWQTHQWEKQKAFWFVAPGPSRDLPHLCLQIPCDNAPSLLVTTSSTSAFGPQGDKYYMQPKIFFAWGDRVLNTAAFERLAEGECPAKHVGKKSSVWETRGRECLLPERI